ncbi:MAG TPA: AtpZ/AtpI family protein [bacterium]|nr:AtpZ/AtpI family protein [bacterium]
MDQGKLPSGSYFLRLSLLGLNFALSIFAGAGLGWAAQKFLGAGDWAFIAGILVGVAAGYYGLFAELKNFQMKPPKPPAP